MKLRLRMLVIMSLLCTGVSAQGGLQLFLGPSIGIGLVSPQNHYGNEHYELDYKFSPAFGGNLNIGYGFNDMISLQLLVGYQQFNQKYADKFRPGLGDLPQSHRKTVNQSYIEFGLLVKVARLLGDSYVYDRGIQLFVETGFVVGKLMTANLHYYVHKDGMEEVEIPYPGNISPYTSSPYTAISKDKDLFTPWALIFNLNLGMDVFVGEKLAFSPSILGQLSLTDTNAKTYRKHDNYKSSRLFFGGINIGVTYFISR